MKRLLTYIGFILALVGRGSSLPQSGDIVVIDDFKYVLVGVTEWARITNDVQVCIDTWAKLNATEEGRVAIHGKRGHTTITNGEITVEYADGWKRTEKLKHRILREKQQATSTSATPTGKKISNKPARLEAIKKRREEVLNKVREITVVKEVGK